MNGADVTTGQMRNAFEEILPNPDDRLIMSSQILRTISYCSDLGSEAWAVSLLERGFRVNVGQVEVMTCFYTGFDAEDPEHPEYRYGMLDFRFLISGPDAAAIIADYAEDVTPIAYRSVHEAHWVARVALLVDGEPDHADRARTLALIEALQSAHRHFVVAAAHGPSGALRKRSNFARSHCRAIVAYAHDVMSAHVAMS